MEDKIDDDDGLLDLRLVDVIEVSYVSPWTSLKIHNACAILLLTR